MLFNISLTIKRTIVKIWPKVAASESENLFSSISFLFLPFCTSSKVIFYYLFFKLILIDFLCVHTCIFWKKIKCLCFITNYRFSSKLFNLRTSRFLLFNLLKNKLSYSKSTTYVWIIIYHIHIWRVIMCIYSCFFLGIAQFLPLLIF